MVTLYDKYEQHASVKITTRKMMEIMKSIYTSDSSDCGNKDVNDGFLDGDSTSFGTAVIWLI